MYKQSLAGPWLVTAKNATTFTITIEGGASTTYTTSIISQRFPAAGVHAPGFEIITAAPLTRTVSFDPSGIEVVFSAATGPELVIVCRSLDQSIALPPVNGTPISFTYDGTPNLTHG